MNQEELIMIKRVFTILLITTLCVGMLAGCKKDVGTQEDNAVKSDESTTDAVPTFTFGFSCITMENPYFITLEASVREQVEIEGNTLITMDPVLNSDTQNEQITEMIDQGIDAIFLCPVDWEKIQPSIDALKKAKVKIINLDTEVKDMDSVDAYIGTDNKNAGYICGEDLIKKCPNGGKIVILEAPSMNSINDRITGFEEAIVDKGFEVVTRQDVQGDLNKSLEAATKIFAANPDIVAVMCGNDPTALGALVAANASLMKDVIIYGIDGSPDLKKELAKPNSIVAGTAAQSPISMGKKAVEVALNILNGKDFEKETYEETFLITKENVDMYGVDGWQ